MRWPCRVVLLTRLQLHFAPATAAESTAAPAPALNAYLPEITDRLFPNHQGELHVHSIRDSDFNAVAMPSGSICFNAGALLRIPDEAQLATALGHEGTHYTADHAFKQVVRDKRTAGTLILTPLFTLSLWAGYSREQEREADRGGFERMSSSGYDGHASWKYDRLWFSDETGAPRDGPALLSGRPGFRLSFA